jgi:signal recognition particle GTPase
MGKPVAMVGTGQKYDDLEPFQAEAIVKNLIG